MEIVIPGGTRRSVNGRTGPQFRIGQIRSHYEYLPAWRCDSLTKGRFYLCGKCFAKLGDGPATNAEEMWMSGLPGGEVVPSQAWCHDCKGRAWPID